MYFITGNKGKFEEVKAMLPFMEQLDLDLPEIQELDAHAIIRAKLHAAFEHKTGEFIVEDTSLYLDCLHSLPGTLIKWFLKAMGPEGLARLAVVLGDKKAQAKVIIGYAKSPEEVVFFEGVIHGTIVLPRGLSGFGWDTIFQPEGYEKTFGEMSRTEKNAISMRRISLMKLKEYLKKQ